MRPLPACGLRVLTALYRVYYRTLRIRLVLPDGRVISPAEYPFGRQIFALCERDVVALAGIMAGRGFRVLVAHGRDGDWATVALEALECHVVRGASRRRGAAALLSLVRQLEASAAPGGFVVDGPLGPGGEAKPGAILCARATGRSICPLGAAAQRAIVFARAWSRIYLPLPFSRVVISCGAPLTAADAHTRTAIEALARALTASLSRTRAHAEHVLDEERVRSARRRWRLARGPRWPTLPAGGPDVS